jgi:hypothetical protein
MNYQMTVDYRRHLLTIEMFAYEVDTAKFFVEMQAAVSQAKGGGQHFDVFVDFTQMKIASPVMPRNISEESAEMNRWAEAHGLRKSASVLTSALFKLQLQRVNVSGQYGYFDNHADAIAWLNEA